MYCTFLARSGLLWTCVVHLRQHAWRAFVGGDESPPFHGGQAGREFRCHKAILGERVWRLQSFGVFTEADKGRTVAESTLPIRLPDISVPGLTRPVFQVSQEIRASMQDPSLVEGSEKWKKQVFRYVRDEIKARVRQFVQETGNQ